MNLINTSILFLFIILSFSEKLYSNENSHQEIQKALNDYPFIKNEGQFKNMDNTQNEKLFYKASYPNLDFYLTNSGITYTAFSYKEKNGNENEHRKVEWERIDVKLIGANINSKNIVSKDNAPYYYNYYISEQKIYNIRPTRNLILRNVYPNIDWIIYSNENGIKYDFIVKPGGNPNDINIEYTGLNPLTINNKGDLIIKHKYGTITDSKPISLQENNQIETQYNIHSIKKSIIEKETIYKTLLSFKLPNYNKEIELVIDPQIEWSSFFGGNGQDGPAALAKDINNNIYTTGYTGSTNFPTINNMGYYQGTYNGGNSDGFLIKFDSNSNLIWATFFGGSSNDAMQSMAIDNSGNIFVGGFSFSSNFPTLNNGNFFQGNNNGSRNPVITKFDNNGVLMWSTYFGGNGSDYLNSMDCDAQGNLFITGGITSNASFPLFNSGGYFQPTNNGVADAFISKFSNTGTLLWSTHYGGSDNDYSEALCVDNLGNVTITGNTKSSNFPTQNNGGYFQGTLTGGTGPNGIDMFITKFDNNGNRIYSTYYGGSLRDYGKSIDSDSFNNIFIGGSSSSTDIPTQNSGNFFQGNLGGQNDAFLLKFDVNGNRLWASYYGGTNNEWYASFENLEVDECNNIYLAFQTESNDITTQAPCDGGYYNSSHGGGGYDQFITKFSNDCQLLWASYIGGSGNDIRSPLTVDYLGNVYLSGEWQTTSNTTYPILNNSGGYLDGSPNGMDDGYFVKFSSIPFSYTLNTDSASCGCNGSANISVNGGCSPFINWYDNSWNNLNINDTIITNLCPGQYFATIIDTLICPYKVDTTSFQIDSGSLNGFSINLNSNDVKCFGGNDGSAWVSSINGGTAPFSYLWNTTPSQTTDSIFNLSTGSYIITITDSLGCTSTDTIIVNEPSAISDTILKQDVSCFNYNNGNAWVNVNGGITPYNFSWSTSPIQNLDSISNLSPGLYHVTITDSNGCSISDSIIINQPSELNIIIDSLPTQCNTCSGSLNANINGGSGGYSILWSPGNYTTPNIDSLCPGIYIITVNDSNGCQAIDSATINQSNDIGTLNIITTNCSCNGICNGSALIDTTGIGGTSPYSYMWFDSISGNPIGQNTIIATNLCSGGYFVEVTDSLGCKEYLGISISEPARLLISIGNDTTICLGDSLQISSNTSYGIPPYLYNWYNSNNNMIGTDSIVNISPLINSNYYLIITDSNNCSASDTINIQIFDTIVYGLTNGKTICKGDSINIGISNINGGHPNGYLYSWELNSQIISNQNNITISPLNTSTYYITIHNSCETILDSVIINVDSLNFDFIAENNGCEPFTTNFIVSPNNLVNCLWNFGDGGTSTNCNPTHTFINSGNYNVTLTASNNNGCTKSITKNNYITVYPKPIADFIINPNPATIWSPNVQLEDKSLYSITNWEWIIDEVTFSNSQNPSYSFPSDTGSYNITLIVTNNYGCRDTINHNLIVKGDFTFYVPNSFTPDGDGLNDYFIHKGIGIQDKDFVMMIFDRWGELIFETNNRKEGWNGIAKNGSELAQTDTYVWKIKFKDINGIQHSYIGKVTLIK